MRNAAEVMVVGMGRRRYLRDSRVPLMTIGRTANMI